MSSNAKLPHWDMNAIYPGLESAEFEAGFQTAIAAIDALVEQFDAHGILLRETPPPIDEETRATFETILASYNAVAVQGHTLYAYLSNLISTDSFNESAQARLSELQRHYVKMGQLYTRLTAWLGSLDVEALIAASPLAEAHAFALRQAAELAQHLMSPEEEALAAQLRLTGSGAWAKLYNNYTSQITVPLDIAGQPPTLPITAVRNLAYNPDRAIRQAAYQAELDAWKRHALPIASALNSIKGELLTLAERRRWDSPLDIALFNNNTDHETLDAMLTAAREFFPDFRRYLRAKARVLGVPQLAWYDLFAPVGESKQTWEFPQARAFIEEQFGAYSDQLAALARRAFEEHWIDAEPRDGKRGGAFCAWMRGGESRILANFQPAYGGMGTLAHELGHAYHNLARAGCTYIQRQTPMTLAETASNFCEALIQEAALAQAPPEEQLAILEASLQDACQVIVDITSRFIFETEVFEKRAARELSAEEFSAIMLAAQRETYGDGLDPEQLHPYMWAVKPHYYTVTFYNFPYMFGLLFSLGLYAQYRENPSEFKERYDSLLAATGMADAATLAARFGINVRTPDFWRASLDIIRGDIDRFEALCERVNV